MTLQYRLEADLLLSVELITCMASQQYVRNKINILVNVPRLCVERPVGARALGISAADRVIFRPGPELRMRLLDFKGSNGMN